MLLVISLGNSIAQNKELKIHDHLDRFYMDWMPFLLIYDPPGKPNVTQLSSGNYYGTNETRFGGGFQYRVGNNFLLPNNHNNIFLRLTWLRIGIYGIGGAGFLVSPLNLGLGKLIPIGKSSSFQPMLTGAFVMISDDIIYPDTWGASGTLIAEAKFKFNRFNIGAEYSWRPVSVKNTLKKAYYHYIGLSMGFSLHPIKAPHEFTLNSN